MSKAPQIQPRAGRTTATVIASFVLPGSGHLLLGKRLHGLCLLPAYLAGLALVIAHLAAGLSFFEQNLGAFLFPPLMRALLVMQAFAALDSYLWCVDPLGTLSLPSRRAAAALNVMIPGAGYALARTWLRAGTAVAVLTLVLIFARGGRHPYLDLIYVGLQLVMALAVYHQMGATARADRPDAAARLPVVGAGQVALLLLLTTATLSFVYITQLALPGKGRVTANEIQMRPIRDGIRFGVSRLGLSMTARGPGWTSTTNPGSGFLFSAQHEKGASLMVGLQPIPSFVRTDRYFRRIRAWLQGQGLQLQKTTDIQLGNRTAKQMLYRGPKGLDHFCIAVPAPEQKAAYLVLIRCKREVCQELEELLLDTRNSFRLGD